MAYNGRKFLAQEETVEQKTRKYTRPYPIVTSHLRNLQQSLFSQPVLRSPIPRSITVPPMHVPIFQDSYQLQPPQHLSLNRKRRKENTQVTFSVDASPSKRRKPTSTETSLSHTTNEKYRKDEPEREQIVPDRSEQGMSEEIESFSNVHQQSDDMLKKKLRLRSAILTVIRKHFPTASLHLVGSSCNGFATESSDADFCVMFTHLRKVDQKYEACTYLRTIQKLFRTMSSMRQIQLIRATVPILKFEDSISGCECDLNINNPVGIRNTHLMRTYSKVDDRVRPMVMTVKRWAKARNINDASSGTLSSYSLVLMVLHYLQYGCDYPVLKSLQTQYPDCFNPNSNVDQLPMFEPADIIQCNSSQNKQSVGELLQGFFDYFVNKFSYESEIMSVRLGHVLPRSSRPEWRTKWICIEEPFEKTNTARAVYSYNYYLKIKDELQRAHNRLKNNLSLEAIL